MDCDKYLAWISARLDGALTEDEERELEEHLAACPDCRAAGAQPAALQAGFAELEETEAPEGFARGVMGRIREEASPKVIPLFRRPRVRALAGLAACAALVVGLYGASRRQNQEEMMLMTRSFNHDVVMEFDAAAQESLSAPEDGEAPACGFGGRESVEDVPQIAAYAAPENGEMVEMQKSVPSSDADSFVEDRLSSVELSENTMAMNCLPEGAAELIPPETAAQPYPGGGTVYLDIPKDIYDQIEQLAVEQGMTWACALTGDGGAEEGPFTLIILEE